MHAAAVVDELDAVGPRGDNPATLGELLLEKRLLVPATHRVAVGAAAGRADAPASLGRALDAGRRAYLDSTAVAAACP